MRKISKKELIKTKLSVAVAIINKKKTGPEKYKESNKENSKWSSSDRDADFPVSSHTPGW